MKTDERPSFTISTEALTLIKALASAEIETVFTHGELMSLIGGTDHRPLIRTINDYLVKDHRRVLGSVRGVGYKLLTALEVLDKGDDFRRRQRKANRRRINELKTVEPEQLPDDTRKSQYFREVAHSALIGFIHEGGQQGRIAKAAVRIQPRPDAQMTLEQLKELHGFKTPA